MYSFLILTLALHTSEWLTFLTLFFYMIVIYVLYVYGVFVVTNLAEMIVIFFPVIVYIFT